MPSAGRTEGLRSLGGAQQNHCCVQEVLAQKLTLQRGQTKKRRRKWSRVGAQAQAVDLQDQKCAKRKLTQPPWGRAEWHGLDKGVGCRVVTVTGRWRKGTGCVDVCWCEPGCAWVPIGPFSDLVASQSRKGPAGPRGTRKVGEASEKPSRSVPLAI